MEISYLPFSELMLMSLLALSPVLSDGQDYDFFYLVLQWPASHCNTGRGRCCYPKLGKPVDNDFGIHGLWPNYEDPKKKFPSFCDRSSRFDVLELQLNNVFGGMLSDWPTRACPSDYGFNFWKHEWEKHGTCSLTVLNQHQYFHRAVDLKWRADIVRALANAGITPTAARRMITYETIRIKQAIGTATGGHMPGIQCNQDRMGKWQLYQVFICVDKQAANFVKCPPQSDKCRQKTIAYPEFSGGGGGGDHTEPNSTNNKQLPAVAGLGEY